MVMVSEAESLVGKQLASFANSFYLQVYAYSQTCKLYNISPILSANTSGEV